MPRRSRPVVSEAALTLSLFSLDSLMRRTAPWLNSFVPNVAHSRLEPSSLKQPRQLAVQGPKCSGRSFRVYSRLVSIGRESVSDYGQRGWPPSAAPELAESEVAHLR